MKLKNEESWKVSREKNSDPYGKGILDYAECWADLMEVQINAGSTVADCAKVTASTADTEGITGFMYGAAVAELSACWFYGEDLRTWHNLDTQIRDEGEKANKSGAVLNPAVLTVSSRR